jgi:hypothetical protein
LVALFVEGFVQRIFAEKYEVNLHFPKNVGHLPFSKNGGLLQSKYWPSSIFKEIDIVFHLYRMTAQPGVT